MTRQPTTFRERLAWGSLILAVLTPVWFAAAGFGHKFGLWSYSFGLGKMTVAWGPILLGIAALFAVIAIIVNLIKAPRRGALVALAALAIPLLIFGRLAGFGQVVAALPPIHDVQTDWTDPIRFSEAVMVMRGADANPVQDDPVVIEAASARWPDAAGKRVADLQAGNYPQVQPILLTSTPERAFAGVLAAVEEQGWTVHTADREAGVIEATAETFWYGFKDDIAIRIRPVGEGPEAGSRVDIRSTSRVGLSDLGANASRIHDFSREIKRLAE
jgi:fatty-acyl-CoA synthase